MKAEDGEIAGITVIQLNNRPLDKGKNLPTPQEKF